MAWLRRAGIVVGAVIGAALAIVLIATALLYTVWGQQQVREFAEQELGKRVRGDVTVLSTSFGLDGEIRLDGLVVMHDGQLVASVDSLVATVELVELVNGRFIAPVVEVDGLVWDTRVDLVVESTDSADDGDDNDALRIDRLVVTNATVVVDDRGRARRIEAIDAVASVRGDVIAVVDARATTSGIDAVDATAAVDLATGDVAVYSRVSGAAVDIAAAAQEPRWLAAADVEIAATRAGAGRPWRITVAGSVGGADVAADVLADPASPAATGRVRATGIELHRAWRGAPVGALDVTVRLGDGAELVTASGPVDVVATGRGEIEGVPVRGFEAGASGTRHDARAWITAETSRGPVSVTATATMPGDVRSVHVAEASLTGDITALVRMIEAAPAVASVRVAMTGRGPIESLDVAGDVDIRGLRDGTTRVRSTTGRVAVRGLSVLDPASPMRGSLGVTLRGLDEAGRKVDYVRADGEFWNGGDDFELDVTARGLEFASEVRGDVTVARRGAATSLAFGDVTVATGRLAWRGTGGRVTVAGNGRMTVDDVALSSAAGTIEVDGVLQPQRRRAAEGSLKIRANNISLGRASPALAFFGVNQILAGTVSARIDLSRRSRDLDVEGRVVYDEIRWYRDAPALTGHANVDLGGRELRFTGEVRRAGQTGSATWQVQTTAPRSTLDVAAWRRLDIDDIVESRVTVRDIAASLIEAAVGQALPVDGRIRGDVVFPNDGRRELGLAVRAADVSYRGVSGLTAGFDGAWDDERLAGAVTLSHQGAPVLAAAVGARVGVQELWSARTDHLADRSLEARASIRDFDLRRIEEAGLTAQLLIGKFSGDVVVSGTARGPRIALERGTVLGLRAAGVPFERLRIDVAYQASGVDGTLRAEQSAGGSIAIAGGYDLTDGTLAATVASTGFDLQVLRVFAADEADPLSIVAGTLDASVHVSGPVDAVAVNGTVGVRGGQTLIEDGSRQIDDIELSVELRGDYALINEVSARSGVGTASATGQVEFSDWEFNFDVVADEIPVVAGEFVAAVDVDGTLAGRREDGWFVAQAMLFDGTVTLSDTGRELQRIGTLEDVVVVERLGGDGPTTRRSSGSDGAIDRVRLQVFVINEDGLRVKSREVDARVGGDLVVEYDRQLSSIRGGIEARSGNVVLFDERYDVIDAWADFDGSIPINPDIYVELRRTFPAATVTIVAQGTVDDTDLAFSSDNPDYDETQILSIMLGQDPDDTAVSDVTPQDRAGQVALNLALRELRDGLSLPVDVVRTYDDGFELGRWLSDRLLLGYRYRDTTEDNENSQEIRLEYRILRNLIFEGTAGNRDVHGADLLYILRF